MDERSPDANGKRGQDPDGRWEGLRRAADTLRGWTDDAVIAGLSAALDLWREPGGYAARAARELSRAAGSSETMIGFGLERMLAAHTPESLRRWTAEARVEAARVLAAADPRGEPPPLAALSGPPVIAQILAGNVAGLALPAVMEGLLARSAVVLKSAEGDPVSAPLMKEALDRAAPALGQSVLVETWRGGEGGEGGDRAAEDRVLSSVDYVVATGGEEMVSALAERVSVPHVLYGPRFSIGVVGMEWMQAPPGWWEAVAREIVLWDQAGCLSPRILFVAGSPGRFAHHLAQAMAVWEARWPAPRWDAATARAVHGFRAPYEMADGTHAGSLDPGSTAWTVVWDEDPTLDAGPPARVVRVAPRLGVRAFGEMLLAQRDRIQGMGTAFLASGEAGWKRAAGWTDVPWRADLTAVQDPPAGWRADGRSGLARLLSWKAP